MKMVKESLGSASPEVIEYLASVTAIVGNLEAIEFFQASIEGWSLVLNLATNYGHLKIMRFVLENKFIKDLDQLRDDARLLSTYGLVELADYVWAYLLD